MEVRLLGPVEVHADTGQLPVRGPIQRALVAMLALHANRVVASQELLASVWGPASTPARRSLQWQVWPTTRVSITAGARVDRWRNYNARNLETTVATGLPTAASRTLPERDDTVVSPRLAALFHLTDRVTAWGSIELAVEAMRKGVGDFVLKPWENARLLETLRAQLEREADANGSGPAAVRRAALRAAVSEHRRASSHREQLERLERGLRRKIVELPFVFRPQLDMSAVELLADRIETDL